MNLPEFEEQSDRPLPESSSISDSSPLSELPESPADFPLEKDSPAARKLEPLVLAHVLAKNYQPVKPKVIAKQMKLRSDQLPALKLAIRRLVKAGKLAYGSSHMVRKPDLLPPLPPESAKAREGTKKSKPARDLPVESTDDDLPDDVVNDLADETLDEAEAFAAEEAAADSSAEVDPDDFLAMRAAKLKENPSRRGKDKTVTGKFKRAAAGFGFVRPLDVTSRGDRTQDIFIPQNASQDAANGDIVRVRLVSGGRSLRKSGEIVEILERDTHQFVGVYQEQRGSGVVEVDGRVFAVPISVGDPGAKGAAPGDKVVIEMVRFPSHTHEGEAVITEVLGARGTPGIDTLSIMREYELPEAFPEAVLAASREEAEKFDESIGDRRDFTKTTVITIDPVDARDFDDAISLTKLESGNYQLGVHIADVSHFVKPKSVLDREARDRATSVYLPDRVLPMLPEIISNNLASLQPDKVRYAQTAIIEFSPEGTPLHSEFYLSAIKSCRRFTYEEVDDYLADRQAWKKKLKPQVHELLGVMHELAMILRRRRLERGAIELSLPETKIDLDKKGEVSGAHLSKNTESHQIIEEFMLAANEAVARHLNEKELPFLRRIHENPDLRKLQVLTKFVRELGIECDSLESRFEIKRVIKEVAGAPEEHAVNYAVLRAMQKAIYSPAVEGHYALHSEHYCHFTSPIRRYPDLTIHRMLRSLIHGKKPAADFASQVLLAEHCSEREQRAQAAERDLIKVKLLGYLSKRVGSEMDAVITGVEEFGIFVMGIDLPAEGLIHIQSLEDDYYKFDSDTHSLTGRRAGNRFRLGDVLRVSVAKVDVDRRELDFRFVGRLKSDRTHLSRLPRSGVRMRQDVPDEMQNDADFPPRRNEGSRPEFPDRGPPREGGARGGYQGGGSRGKSFGSRSGGGRSSGGGDRSGGSFGSGGKKKKFPGSKPSFGGGGGKGKKGRKKGR